MQRINILEKKLVIKVEVYSRVAGYFRPVNQWNKGKREEFSERLESKIPEEINNASKDHLI